MRLPPPDASLLPPLFGKPRALAIAAGVLLLATLLVFGDLLFAGGGQILSRPGTDISGVFVGWCEFTVREMAGEHNLPLWNPHLFSGAPCLGGFQEALLYPSTWLLFIMPIPQAINWGIALHVFLAGLFTYMWMARRGVHPAAATVSGMVFMFGGGYFMHITAGHLPNLRTMVWAPLIFLAIDDITSTRSLRGAWLGAFALMMQILAGHPQYTYYNALIAGPYTLLALWRAPSRPRAVLGLGLMGVGGVAMSAIQLFTGLSAAQESLRSGLRFDVASTFPFPPENLLTMVLPGFFGQISEGFYWGRWLLWEDSLFIGVGALSLAMYGAFRGDKSYRPGITSAFIIACLLIAFGKYTPLYGLLYRFLPGFDSFRGVSKVAFLAALFLANLAGVGLDRLLRGHKPSAAIAITLASAAIGLASTWAFVSISGKSGSSGAWARALSHIDFSSIEHRVGNQDRALLIKRAADSAADSLLAGAVAAGAFSLAWFMVGRSRRIVMALAVLTAAELVVFGWQNRPTFDLQFVTDAEIQMRQFLEHAKVQKEDGSFGELPPDARLISDRPSIVLGAGGNEAWGNDPMVLRRYAEFMAIDQKATAYDLMLREYPFFTPKTISPTWRMLRVDVVLVPVDGQTREVPVRGRRLARAQLIEAFRVIEDPEKRLAAIADRRFDPRVEVLLEKPAALLPAQPLPGAGSSPGMVSLTDRSTDEIEITAEITRPCVLLLSDNYSTGWHVVPWGKKAPQNYEVVPANHTLRAIPLMPGSHHFLLEYSPTAWIWGKWVTCIALIIWGLAAVKLWGRPKKNVPRVGSD